MIGKVTTAETRRGLLVPSLISTFLLIGQTLGTIDAAHAQKKGSLSNPAGKKTSQGIQAHEAAGLKASGQGYFQIAIKEFTIVLDEQPQRIDILLARADAYYKALEIDSARADCDRAIQMDPKSAEAFLYRARCLYFKNDYDAGLKDLNRALQLDPKLAEAREMQGSFRLMQKDYKNALESFNNALKLDPRRQKSLQQRSMAYSALKMHKEAIKDLTEYIKLQPRPHNYQARAAEYEAIGDYKNALADTNKAISLAEDRSTDYQVIRARLYCRNLQHDRAADEYSKLLTLSPEDDELISQRGNEYMHLKRYRDALKEYTRAISLDPELPTYYRLRSQAYAKAGDSDRAAKDRAFASRLARQKLERKGGSPAGGDFF